MENTSSTKGRRNPNTPANTAGQRLHRSPGWWVARATATRTGRTRASIRPRCERWFRLRPVFRACSSAAIGGGWGPTDACSCRRRGFRAMPRRGCFFPITCCLPAGERPGTCISGQPAKAACARSSAARLLMPGAIHPLQRRSPCCGTALVGVRSPPRWSRRSASAPLRCDSP